MKKILILLLLLPLAAFSQNANQKQQIEKLGNAANYITSLYVEPVNTQEFVDKLIKESLSRLDPHSTFVSKKEAEEENARMAGGFYGIGCEPKMIRDTIAILAVIEGGPAHKSGLKEGDRIIQINEKNTIGLTDDDLTSLFRGEKGSILNARIVRKGIEPFDMQIIRDKIAMKCIDVAYFIAPKVAFIKISRFTETTNSELLEALGKLKGAQSLILDLRGNGGGNYTQAVEVVSNFIEPGRLVVYGEGNAYPRKDELSHGNPSFLHNKLVVLVDQQSASASELVSGALQDWDRATIVGRRTFGKGLMQGIYPLGDGSFMRLTIGRYYTPSGRCVQRPYEMGDSKGYYKAAADRLTSGELASDKVNVDSSQVFYTLLKGRKVYGGGGIIPDIIVPLDTTTLSKYMNDLYFNNVFFDFIVDAVDAKRDAYLKKYPTFEKFRKDYVVPAEDLDAVAKLGEKHGVPYNEEQLHKSKPQIENFIKASLARRLYNKEDFFKILNDFHTHEIQKALEVLAAK